tara:strand:+ start:35752 stop:35997 length:246 start_codon:yes stop_codon:yes gene_type:complete
MATPLQLFDPQVLKDLVTTKMYFGKYSGTLICDVPVHYLEWLDRKGMPPGKAGMLLSTTLVIKSNGLEDILRDLKRKYGNR